MPVYIEIHILETEVEAQVVICCFPEFIFRTNGIRQGNPEAQRHPFIGKTKSQDRVEIVPEFHMLDSRSERIGDRHRCGAPSEIGIEHKPVLVLLIGQ
jgi:hypothetical protein